MTGFVLIIATVAAVLAPLFVPDVTATDYLTLFSIHSSRAVVGIILYLLAAFTSVGIAILLYPIVRESHPTLAIGSVVFRTIEAVMYIVAVLALFTLISISRLSAASSEVIGSTLVSMRDYATLLGVWAFCLGAFMYYYSFLKTRVIPRWLSGWGVFGVLLMLTACIMASFSGKPITGYVALVLPIALQEMVLAIWLIAKGLEQPQPSSLS